MAIGIALLAFRPRVAAIITPMGTAERTIEHMSGLSPLTLGLRLAPKEGLSEISEGRDLFIKK
eukprot:2807983-Pleurochrysis_carterae.AAC.1